MTESEELQILRKERTLQRYLRADRDLISPEDGAALLVNEVTAGPDGSIDPASCQLALAKLRRNAPYMFRSSRVGMGDPMQGVPAPRPLTDAEKVEQLFGRKSDARKAQNLKRDNPAEYRRLKALALQSSTF